MPTQGRPTIRVRISALPGTGKSTLALALRDHLHDELGLPVQCPGRMPRRDAAALKMCLAALVRRGTIIVISEHDTELPPGGGDGGSARA